MGEDGSSDFALVVLTSSGEEFHRMAYDAEQHRFTKVDGDYYVQFVDEADAATFLVGAPVGPVSMIQGGDGWSNDGGMTLQPNGDITNKDGAAPFHANEAKWALETNAKAPGSSLLFLTVTT